MDFLRARMFRGTLLCHGELEPDRKVLVDRLSQLALSAGEKVDFSPHDLSSTEPLEFQMLGREISASAPITKQALAILGDAYPAAVPMVELSEAAWSKIGGATGQYYHLYEDLMAMFSRGVLRAVVDPPSFLATPVDPPRTTPLARDQAIHNLPITNRLHETVVLDPVPLWTLRYLDGKHSAGELVRLLIDAVKRGDFEVSDDQGPIKDLHSSIAGEIIDHALSRLAENALLVS